MVFLGNVICDDPSENCCSSDGHCGKGDSFCGAGCQESFSKYGICYLPDAELCGPVYGTSKYIDLFY